LKTLSQNPANNKVRQRLVLVTGDSDFVPAAKLARREGVEFLLDPLWQQVSDELYALAIGGALPDEVMGFAIAERG
jgi:uncharacterized LabA/DUF88 family protein